MTKSLSTFNIISIGKFTVSIFGVLLFCGLLTTDMFAQSNNENYILSKTYKNPYTSPVVNPNALQAFVEITYYDGLGRAKQHIGHQQAGDGGDLITHIEYDALGRQIKEYLPYVRNASLDYDNSAKIQVETFYTNPANGPTTNNPWSETLFENSALNRVLKQAAPGDDWNINSENTIDFSYETNKTNEIHHYSVNTFGEDPILIYHQKYPVGQLYKTVTKTEHWRSNDNNLNTIVEYKNKLGQIILRRSFNENMEPIGAGEKVYDTYYIYDLYGNLTFVFPPKLSGQIPSNGIPSMELIDALAYQYQYDYRNRIRAKKIPGKKWEYMQYDSLDRLIATGPTLSPFGDSVEGWLHTKYDKVNRIAYAFWKQGLVESQLLPQPETDISESRTSNNTTVNGVSFNYTNNVLPTSGFHVLSVNYYDDYEYDQSPSSIPSTVGENGDINVYYNNTIKPVGLLTGSWERMLEGKTHNNGLIIYTLFDKKARPVRAESLYPNGGRTQVDTKFNFIGDPIYSLIHHKKDAQTDEIKIKESFSYTPQSRLLMHTHKVNENAPRTLTENSYDALGREIQKKVGAVGSVGGSNPLQTIDYKYNIRGWLTDINNVDQLNQPHKGSIDLFAFRIKYNEEDIKDVNGTVKRLYNGNIAETFWRSATDNIKRKYGYSYDAQNRLTAAYYQLPGTAVPYSNSYSTEYTYDLNGNILSLKRNGERDDPVNLEVIDTLDYIYDMGNILQGVEDIEGNPAGYNDRNEHSSANPDFEYDDYGNLTRNRDKEISNIVYNHLHLPVEITFDGGQKIEYLYTALGIKLEKTATDDNNSATTTEYMDASTPLSTGGFQYRNDVLEFFPHAEGYVQATQSGSIGGGTQLSFHYVYNYTDHTSTPLSTGLGNIRLKYTTHPQTGEIRILEENHYYPYGLTHKGYSEKRSTFAEGPGGGITLIPVTPDVRDPYKYKFGGKEYQEEFDVNVYDFGARNYDPALGRWMNVDPLAEQMRRHSPYNFAFDNPIYFIDPDGMMPIDPIKMRIFKKTQGNTKGFIVKDFRFTPASNQSWSGTTTTGNITRDSKRSLVIRILQANYGGGEQYTRSASVTTTKNKGQYYDDKGEMVDNINNATKVVISEYTITESIDLYEGGVVGKDMNNEITVNESLSTLTFDVLEGGDLSYKEGFHDSTSKTTKIKNASSDLLQIAEKEASKNKAQYNSQEAQRRANYLKGVMEDNYHDAVREYKQDSYVN